MSLRISALQGVKWTTLSSVCGVAIHILQISILARILTPEDFGLMALGMVAIGFAQAFSDMGISQAIIHKQEITKNQLSTLYWLNIIAACFCSLLLIASSPFIAAFYKNEALIPVLLVISSIFVLQSIGQQYQIILQKNLMFNTIARIDVTSKLVGFFLSITLALLNAGVYALVFGVLFTTLTAALLYLFQGLAEHKPRFVFNLKDVDEFLSFGLYTMGDRAINFFSTQIDTLIIGRLIGVESLGIYSVAKTLVLRPLQVINPIITRVSLPIMAKIQNDKTKLSAMYLEMMSALGSVNFPLYAAAIIFAPALVSILLGEQWHEATLVVQILAVWAMMRSIGNPIGSLVLSQGRYRLGFWWNVFVFVLTVPVVLMGSKHGISGVALSLMIFSIILQIPNWLILVKPLCGAPAKEYSLSLARPLLLSILFALFSATSDALLQDWIGLDLILSMFFSVGFGGVFLLLLYVFFNQALLKDVLKLFK